MICSREHLLGYLLGALEPAEMAVVERELENDPRLRKDLAAIEAALYPLGFPEREDDASQAEPPTGLAARTCEFVEDSKADLVSRPMPAKILAATMSDSGPAGKQRLRWADVIMTASICLAAVSLIFPAIWSVREQQQIAACRDNLQHMGIAVADYAVRSPYGRSPAIPTEGNRSFAGFFPVSLREAGELEDVRWLVCPSSEMAEQIESFRVPAMIEIDRAKGETLTRLRRIAGGSLGFNIGFVEDGEYQAPKHESRANYCLISDAPATFKPTRKTKNHGGRGQNMLYEDCHVAWVVDPCRELCDDPYLNSNGLVAAGNGCTDVVVAESLATPKPAIFMWRW
jgi:hypothetical protein